MEGEQREEVFQLLQRKAQKGKRKCLMLFIDCIYFVMEAFVAIIWRFERIFSKHRLGGFGLMS